MGLWRMASWHREQSSTQKLLSRNFQEPRWKTAALKNAYALLGKRRFGMSMKIARPFVLANGILEYAAAFFLLAGNLQDAVNVCANQLQDLQLAVAVARVYEGDKGLVVRSLLEDKVLPQAALEGNRWLATWSFWMLGRRDMAVRALIVLPHIKVTAIYKFANFCSQSPVYTLVDTPGTPNLQSRSYLANDPALIVLYKQLREKTLQTLKGASKIPPRVEWEFVMQNARLYDRMGCDILALDLGTYFLNCIPSQLYTNLPPLLENQQFETGNSSPNPKTNKNNQSQPNTATTSGNQASPTAHKGISGAEAVS